MSRERALRRAARIAEAERLRADREAAHARRARRQKLLRRLTPRRPDRRTGRLSARRSRGERATIGLFAVVVLAFIWLYVEALPTRLALTGLVVIAAPALVVLTLDRRR